MGQRYRVESHRWSWGKSGPDNMVYQLVPIEDLAEEEEVEDSEIEEGLAIEIAALDPAPPYVQ